MHAPSAKTAYIEDEMVNLPTSSSITDLFEDEKRGGRGDGREWVASSTVINEEVPFYRAGLLVTCRSGRTYFLRFLYLW